jgi:hypothetical protein
MRAGISVVPRPRGLAQRMRLVGAGQEEAAPLVGCRRSDADEEDLRQGGGINAGRARERGNKTGKRAGRCARLPRACKRSRRKQGDSMLAGIDGKTAPEMEKNGGIGDDLRRPGSDFLHVENEEGKIKPMVVLEQRVVVGDGGSTVRPTVRTVMFTQR